jgi:hypothetical protein
MEVIIISCAGLDVHKDGVEACVRRLENGNHISQQTRHWGTMTRDLLAMAEWFRSERSDTGSDGIDGSVLDADFQRVGR